MSSTLQASVFMRKGILRKFTLQQTYWEESHNETDVWHIWKVDSRTIRWDFWSVSNQLGKFSVETVISGQWWRRHQSLACKGLCILRFWFMERWIRTQHCLGTTIRLVQNFITIQNFGHNGQRIDGIRVEYVTRIHYIAARPRSATVHEQNRRTRTIPRTSYLHVDVHCHHLEKSRQWNGMYRQFHTCVFFRKKLSSRTLVIPRTWIRNKVSGIPPTIKRPGREWVKIAELMMMKFGESGHPVFCASSPLSRQTLKSRGGGKLSIHFFADGRTIETVFRSVISVNQLSIYGAVSDLCEEYSSCQTRTRRLVLAGQSDPLFLPTSSLMKTPTPSTDDPAREDLLQKYQERVERPSQQNRVIKICIDAGFLTTVDVGQHFMTKHTDEFLEFAEPVTCREYILPRVDKSSDPKGWIRGNTNIWARVGSHNQLFTR